MNRNTGTRHPIRVAHLIHSPQIGGSEMVAAQICSNLDRSLFDPIFLMLNPGFGQMPEIMEKRGIPYGNLRRTRRTRLLGPVLPAMLLRRLKIDILHVHHVAFFLQIHRAARLAGIPIVCLTEHDVLSATKTVKLAQGCVFAAKTAGFFSVVSQHIADHLVRKLDIPKSRLTVIPNGIDTNRFTPAGSPKILRELLPRGFNGKVILSVGRLAPEKDHANLLKALARLKNNGTDAFHLILVGDGEEKQRLQDRIGKDGLAGRVTLAGMRTDVDLLLPGANLFILSSKTEGLPMALLEAMACGLPVISTDVGGVSEVIDHGRTGLLVPSSDPAALAAQIGSILGNRQFATRLGLAARQIVEKNFSQNKMLDQYSTLYLNLIGKVHGGKTCL